MLRNRWLSHAIAAESSAAGILAWGGYGRAATGRPARHPPRPRPRRAVVSARTPPIGAAVSPGFGRTVFIVATLLIDPARKAGIGHVSRIGANSGNEPAALNRLTTISAKPIRKAPSRTPARPPMKRTAFHGGCGIASDPYEAGPCPVHHARRGEERRRRHCHVHRPVIHRFRSRQQPQPVPPPRCVLLKPGRKRLEIRQRSRDAPIGRSGHRCESGPLTSAIRRAGIFGIAVAAETRGQGPRFGIVRNVGVPRNARHGMER